MSQVLGELKFSQGNRLLTAALDDQLAWHCSDRQIESFLNAAHRNAATPMDVHKPAVHIMYQAAERLGGEVSLSPRLTGGSPTSACA
jgi:hypothetical protein